MLITSRFLLFEALNGLLKFEMQFLRASFYTISETLIDCVSDFFKLQTLPLCVLYLKNEKHCLETLIIYYWILNILIVPILWRFRELLFFNWKINGPCIFTNYWISNVATVYKLYACIFSKSYLTMHWFNTMK